jgi:hypothetical protein
MNPEVGNIVQEILSGVESLADGKIKFREDLERIINIAVLDEKIATLEKISFHAKIAYSMTQIIQRKEEAVDQEFVYKASEEYKSNIVKIKMLINYLLENNNSFIKNIFSEKYFQLSQKCLSNLNSFCSDLSYLKLYFNDKKNEMN